MVVQSLALPPLTTAMSRDGKALTTSFTNVQGKEVVHQFHLERPTDARSPQGEPLVLRMKKIDDRTYETCSWNLHNNIVNISRRIRMV